MSEEKNFVFLDVDGVLNAPSIMERTPSGYIGIYPPKVKLLAEIVQKTNAKIILTSSWRICWPDGLKTQPDADGQYLVNALAKEDLEISDFVVSFRDRGTAIWEYVQEHEHDHWVVLDDESFDFAESGILDHLCKTDFRSGLDEDDVRTAIQILTTDMPDFRDRKEALGGIFGHHFGREL